MNNTTPRRLTCTTIARSANGEPRIAPQPLGTWFSRWHHLYLGAPVAPADSVETVPHLRARPTGLTHAA